jgi:hypothetical protein
VSLRNSVAKQAIVAKAILNLAVQEVVSFIVNYFPSSMITISIYELIHTSRIADDVHNAVLNGTAKSEIGVLST